MNYIITWMEWVEITNNQKEFLCILSLLHVVIISFILAKFQKDQ